MVYMCKLPVSFPLKSVSRAFPYLLTPFNKKRLCKHPETSNVRETSYSLIIMPSQKACQNTVLFNNSYYLALCDM